MAAGGGVRTQCPSKELVARAPESRSEGDGFAVRYQLRAEDVRRVVAVVMNLVGLRSPHGVERHHRVLHVREVAHLRAVQIREAGDSVGPAAETVVLKREGAWGESLCLVICEGLRSHRARAAVRAERDGVGDGRPLRGERLVLERLYGLVAGPYAPLAHPPVEAIAGARGNGQRAIFLSVCDGLGVRQHRAAIRIECQSVRIGRDCEIRHNGGQLELGSGLSEERHRDAS